LPAANNLGYFFNPSFHSGKHFVLFDGSLSGVLPYEERMIALGLQTDATAHTPIISL